ncbi:MAG: hypothetical protein ACOH2H_17925 [Cypionkella sp.]
MPVIGFVDLLASKSSALLSRDDFRAALEAFHRAVLANSGELGSDKKIRVFADCFYFEGASAVKTVEFLQVLRNTLFAQKYFFKGAVGSGSLAESSVLDSCKGSLPDDTSGIDGTTFGADVVKIYLNSERFKGIGFFVDRSFRDTLSQEIGLEGADKFLIGSVFFPDDRATATESYVDIALSAEERSSEDTYFQETMSAFEEAKVLKRKYARFYFPLMMTWLNSSIVSADDFRSSTKEGGGYSIDRSRFIYRYFLSGGQFSAKFSEVPRFEYVYLRLIDKLLNSGIDDERLKSLLISVPSRKRVLSDLSDVPEFIMSYRNRRHLGKVVSKHL